MEVNGRVELISQAEYARRRGVAKSAVAKAVAEKRISLIDGKIDPAVADIQWAQNTRARVDAGRPATSTSVVEGDGAIAPSSASMGLESSDGRQPPAAKDAYQDLRIQRERTALERDKRENDREAKLLVRKDRAHRATFDAFRALRDAVMDAPQQAAPKVIGIGDTREVERIFAEELRTAFALWESQMQKRLNEMEAT